MKRYLNLILFCCFSLFLVGCSAGEGCYKLKCPPNDEACRQALPKVPYTKNGNTQQLGVISYIVTVIKDVVGESSQKIFEKITNDASYKKVVTAMMTLFVAIYGIAIALGMAQLSPFELVMRVVKMAIIYYLLTSWGNFQEIVVNFFEALTNELSTILTTAVVNSAGGNGGNVTAMDVFNFIDEKVLGLLLSVRFAVIMGSMLSMSGVGLIIGLLMFSIVLSYLWTIMVSIQIFIFSSIARALLYAVAPIFIIFLLFKQTSSLFEGWLKQLINFSLQPILLVGFLAFFNGVFFNYVENMFNPGYEACNLAESTTGQTIKLHGFHIKKEGVPYDKNNPVQITEVLNVFTLFVIMMLGTVMVKMNQWAVQAAAQLSEGGITFTNTMQSNMQTSRNVTEGFKKAGQEAIGSPAAKPPPG